MFICGEEYNKVFEVIKYYISKFVKNRSELIAKFNISDFNIQKINDNLYTFTYDIIATENLVSDSRFISGTISNNHIELLAKKTVSTFKSNDFLSFTTIKIGEFKIENGFTNYSNLYLTIKSLNNTDETDYVCYNQMYNFKNGNVDLLNNYSNLIPLKWPILTRNSSDLVKKLQKYWLY